MVKEGGLFETGCIRTALYVQTRHALPYIFGFVSLETRGLVGTTCVKEVSYFW